MVCARWWVVLVVVAVAAGCGNKKKKEKEAPDPGAAEPAAEPTPAPKSAAEVNADEVRAILAGWAKAQNDRDFATYLAHYQKQYFKGVRRTNDGKVVRMGFAGWKKDRRRMFGYANMAVAVEDAEVRSWLDPGSRMKPMTTEVVFTQRWKGGKYADHGRKLLTFWRDPRGRHRIIYEDMLSSEPGWKREVSQDVAAADWDAPDVKTALARWKSLGVTGKNYQDVLAMIPAAPQVRRMMALAVLDGGNFECDQVVANGICGMYVDDPAEIQRMFASGEDVDLSWGDFDLNAGFDHACLRRRLAIWALGQIETADLVARKDEMLAIARLSLPESRLIEAVLAAARDAGDPIRMALIEAAVSSDHRDEADGYLEGLSDANLIALGKRHGLPGVLDELDPAAHTEALVDLLVNQQRFEPDVRRDLLAALAAVPSDEVTAGLAEVAGTDGDCQLAMMAAAELAKRGDATALPARTDDAGANARAVCMAIHDPDGAREIRFWKQMIHPEAGLTASETIEVDDYQDYEDELDDGEEVESEAEPEALMRADVDREALTELFRGNLTAAGEHPASCDSDGECSAGDSERNVTLTFTRARDGELYLSGLSYFAYGGCGC
jgi:hypothetical protein